MSAERPPAAEDWTVRRVLDWTIGYLREQGSDSPRLEAEILLAHARGCPRIRLYTDYNELLSDEERTTMRGYVKRRAAAEPVAYIVGHREFFSLDFLVTRDVLIPRPETESLVMRGIDVAKPMAAPRILDVCTGSGCVAIALAANLPRARVTAIDVSPEALAIAARNVERHQFEERVTLLEGDLLAPVQGEQPFDLIVSNPPYVASAEIETLAPDVARHEPRLALDGGADGFDYIRRLSAESMPLLVSGGWLMFELSPEQAGTAREILVADGYEAVEVIADLSGQPRIAAGRRA